MAKVLELSLPPAPASAAVARRELRALPLPEPMLDALSLLVTELVSNAIRHPKAPADEAIRVRADVEGEQVHVEVTDGGRGFTKPTADVDLTTPGGLGLVLVERLADRWGINGDGRTCVWFDILDGSARNPIARA